MTKEYKDGEWDIKEIYNKDGSYMKKIYSEDDCSTEYVYYDKNGIINREGDLPTMLYYIKNDLHTVIYHKDNKYHRDGYKPAYLEYDCHGQLATVSYYINGEYIDETEINRLKITEKRKNILNKL